MESHHGRWCSVRAPAGRLLSSIDERRCAPAPSQSSLRGVNRPHVRAARVAQRLAACRDQRLAASTVAPGGQVLAAEPSSRRMRAWTTLTSARPSPSRTPSTHEVEVVPACQRSPANNFRATALALTPSGQRPSHPAVSRSGAAIVEIPVESRRPHSGLPARCLGRSPNSGPSSTARIGPRIKHPQPLFALPRPQGK